MKLFAIIALVVCVGEVAMAQGQLGVAYITGINVPVFKYPSSFMTFSFVKYINRPEAYRVLEEQNGWFRLGTNQWVKNDPLYLRYEISRGRSSYYDYFDLDLKIDAGLTAEDIDQWLNSKINSNPENQNSLFRGKGAVFVRAARESGLNVCFLVALAAVESGWGTSPIARRNFNMYGISAFDWAPGEEAYEYRTVNEGIVEGAKWIAADFVNQGQNTLRKMQTGRHFYSSDSDWATEIARIMADDCPR